MDTSCCPSFVHDAPSEHILSSTSLWYASFSITASSDAVRNILLSEFSFSQTVPTADGEIERIQGSKSHDS
jgi:hypothetical protein